MYIVYTCVSNVLSMLDICIERLHRYTVITSHVLLKVSTWFANARRRLKKDCVTSGEVDLELEGNCHVTYSIKLFIYIYIYIYIIYYKYIIHAYF